MSLQAQERKWRLGQAQSRIRAGGTKEGAAGRPRGGLASVLAARLQEAAGRPGPWADLRVYTCVPACRGSGHWGGGAGPVSHQECGGAGDW